MPRVATAAEAREATEAADAARARAAEDADAEQQQRIEQVAVTLADVRHATALQSREGSGGAADDDDEGGEFDPDDARWNTIADEGRAHLHPHPQSASSTNSLLLHQQLAATEQRARESEQAHHTDGRPKGSPPARGCHAGDRGTGSEDHLTGSDDRETGSHAAPDGEIHSADVECRSRRPSSS